MNHNQVWTHKLRNFIHSLLFLGAMMVLLGGIGSMLFGAFGVTLAIVTGMAVLTLGRVSPRWVLRMHRAQPLAEHQAPRLYQIMRELARRADLRSAPALYLVPSGAMNAFAVGNTHESAIGVTQGLLRRLDQRQLAGVLAHEVSHIRNHDLWVMGLAQLLSRMTRGLSLFGQLMLLFALPALMMGGVSVPWTAVLLLVAAPTLSALLQLALSRTREFEADLGAARLTGDPLGLASALRQLEAQQGGWWRFLFPVRRRQTSSMLDSHPATPERIARLESLVDRNAASARPVHRPEPVRVHTPVPVPVRYVRRRPRVVRLPSGWGLVGSGY